MSDGNGRVQIAYLHRHEVSHSFHESMMRLIGYDAANHGRISARGNVSPSRLSILGPMALNPLNKLRRLPPSKGSGVTVSAA